MSSHHPSQSEFSLQGKLGISLMLTAFSALSACVPYPHLAPRNQAIEGRVLSVETGQPVVGAKIELDIGSDERWTLQPEHLAALEEEAPDDLWHCIESAMEKAN